MTSITTRSSLSTMNIGYQSSTFPIIKTIFISCGLIKKITAISNWEKCTDWLLKWYFIVFKYVAWLLLQVTINKSLVPDCRQGCNWSFSRLIFLAYKSQDIEDETLTVMARLVILLYLCHVFFAAEHLLIQTEGNNKMDLQHWQDQSWLWEIQKDLVTTLTRRWFFVFKVSWLVTSVLR